MKPEQRILPMIAYEDGVAAMAWLVRVFGFIQKEKWVDAEGRLAHGELTVEGQSILVASPSPHFRSPKSMRAEFPPAQQWMEAPYIFTGVLVFVEDLEQTFSRAQAEGATLLSPVEEGYPSGRFRVEDLEGNRWMFMAYPAG